MEKNNTFEQLETLEKFFKLDDFKKKILSLENVEEQRSNLKDVFLKMKIDFGRIKRRYHDLLIRIK